MANTVPERATLLHVSRQHELAGREPLDLDQWLGLSSEDRLAELLALEFEKPHITSMMGHKSGTVTNGAIQRLRRKVGAQAS